MLTTNYYVVLDDGTEFYIVTGKLTLVDMKESCHIVPFESVQDRIVKCSCLTFKNDVLESWHHYTGVDARIVASLESRHKVS